MSSISNKNSAQQPNTQKTYGLGKFSTSILAAAMFALPVATWAQSPGVANISNAASNDTAKSFDDALTGHFKEEMPGASVIVTRDGKTLFRKAYGLADVDHKTVLQPDMMMRIGSITKQFTAVAILQLVEAGKLNLNDDLGTVLPAFPAKGQKITIEHLLTHSSGIKNFLAMPGFGDIADKPLTVTEMLDFFKNEPLEFAPGEHFAYSNSGYFLLGLIIEKISGLSYADYLAQHVFSPLNMRHTAFEGRERDAQRRVEGYVRGSNGIQKASPISANIGYAAGALVSTVDDLALWDQAIAGSKLLKPASWQQALRPHVLNDGKSSNYGFGWMSIKIQGVAANAHDGIIPGFNSFVMRIPEQKVFVAVLSNDGRLNPNSAYMAEKIAAIAIGKPFPEYKAIQLAPDVLDQILGVYKINAREDRIVSRTGSQVFIQRSGKSKMEILPYSATEFFVKDSPARIHMRFEKNANGEVRQMVLVQNQEESISPRTSNQVPASAGTPGGGG
ncbi:serine hydrolase domain-containing protein [Undibacterium sp. JH2W]|uniref:serine hydrolase domain-containing protein n=1 Tax=Undibacterium sp. JH2W TaxID=3413037 RepID=UPI003BF244D0